MTEKELFFRYLGLPSLNPIGLDIVRAEGVYVYDRSGRDYIDMVSGITVSNTGHRHPVILKAIRDQLDLYLHVNVYGEFIHSPQVMYARALVDRLPPGLDSVFFVNSGSEAVEGALKLAKRYTGRPGIVAFKNAYHGSTHGALSVMGHESLKTAFRPLLPGITLLEYNNFCDLEIINSKTACVIAETTQAEAGLILSSDGFLSQLRKRCNETGSLLIFDDIQMGFGRTGFLYSFEPYGIEPDILVLAKALGGGMPLGAFIAGKKVMESLAFNPELGHITTFGGHPVSCAAGLATLGILTSGELMKEVESKGVFLEEMLRNNPLVSGKNIIREIRRKGLAFGLDLADPSRQEAFLRACINQGIIIDFYLFRNASFRLAPPLTISFEEMEKACGRLELAITEIA
jgi:acetylornithine/succinyldiaminopimelate/putrescine aminotransferase